jgi:hypothetical protein
MHSVRIFIIAMACALALPSYAKAPRGAAHPASAAAEVVSAQPDEAQLQEHGHYTNSSGKVVHAPAHTVTGAAPAGASAQCRDGSYSFSAHHRGTCSHHGGVAAWM